MSKKRLEIDWNREVRAGDLTPALKRFGHYLRDNGFRNSTIESHVGYVRRYLEFVQTETPSVEVFVEFRESLQEKSLSRSSINNYCFAIKKYHELLGSSIEFPFLKKNDEIPYYFDEDDVLRIFSVCHNIKHLAMLQTLFYGCLRASELCHLDDGDIDLKNLTIRVREGKGGKDDNSLPDERVPEQRRRRASTRNFGIPFLLPISSCWGLFKAVTKRPD